MNENTDSVERKVQLTGGSTYTVSLPKAWATEQSIEPGTQVVLNSRGDQLLMTKESDPAREGSTATLDAGEHGATTLSLSVAAAYTAGCDEIHVESLHDTDKRRAITRVIRRFVGLEVMTETEDTLQARTMLDVGDLSPAQTLAQVERTTLEMHGQALQAIVEADVSLAEQVATQDDDVDRLFALVSRGFQQSLVDPAVTTDGHLTPFEYYMAARQLERIADHAEKVATLAGRLTDSPPADIADELVSLGERSRALVRKALSGLLAEDDTSELTAVVVEAEDLLARLDALDEQLYERDPEDGYPLGLAVDSLTRTTQYGVNIAEAGMQAAHR